MQSMGPGGGFVLNIYVAAERRAYTLNARETAPSGVTNDMFKGFSRHDGSRSVAIPGEILGYWELHKRFATLSWKEVIAPTISICRRGFVMSKHMADQLDPRFKSDRKLRLVLCFYFGIITKLCNILYIICLQSNLCGSCDR